MAEDTMITDELKGWIGREWETVTGDPILARDIKRYAMAIGDRNPLYHDEEYAKTTEYGSIVAPPSFVLCAAHPVSKDHFPDELRSDGLHEGDVWPFMYALPIQRVVRGGDEFDFHEPIRPGDVITVRTKVADITEKISKTGPMIVTTIEEIYSNQKGDLVAVHRMTGICR